MATRLCGPSGEHQSTKTLVSPETLIVTTSAPSAPSTPWASVWACLSFYLAVRDPEDAGRWTNQSVRLDKIHLDEGRFRHFAKKHKRESLADLFGRRLSRRLRHCFAKAPLHGRHQILDGCASHLERAVRAAVEQGYVIAYQIRESNQIIDVWLVFLAAGAIIVLRRGPDGTVSLRTVFFPRDGLKKATPAARFRAVVACYARRYARLDSRRGLVPRLPDDPRLVRGEARTNVRFGSLKAFGFRPDLAGCPNRGSVGPLPVSGAEPVELRRRCKPANRYRWLED
jgi:hypothetical protein